jgi:hypothetical protein
MTLGAQINGWNARRGSHQSQQLLSPPQEAVLCNWIEFHALVAKPLDIEHLQCLVADLAGRPPSQNWIYLYKKCWPQLSYSRPGGLDPKWAQNFNPSNVVGFYKLLKAVYDVYPNFLPQHIWNMDEKGLQLGGGRK